MYYKFILYILLDSMSYSTLLLFCEPVSESDSSLAKQIDLLLKIDYFYIF